MHENICLKSGCPGLCCRDTDIQVTKYELKRLWPNVIYLDTLKELRSGQLEEGIPYCARLRTKKLGDSGFFEVGWMGNCPNLLPDGTCKHYEEREHAARNFKFGSIDCNNVRVSYGLPPVEPVE
jgi:hypothetical protein